ncbi:MAG TPA: UDP-N-acetylmuramoyl-tripeptide--D-alanyl-D-alanine ligase [Gemmatimonadaceae bacterium]|jgi:UDP-N-acetylmuramoyl-tripeptide--D-alanyl-D-alanine ligase
MNFWSWDRVADALQPFAAVNLPRGLESFARIWSDTRTIARGDLFVALVGERFDAHEFLQQAVASGAGGLVVSRAEGTRGLGVPVFEVRDTLVALGALGRYRRCAWGNPVVGVVGTNGKTSTKELLKAALGSTLSTHATYGNLNNLVGVPLTLLAIPDEADVAVIEMGTNQPGEVARLRAVVEPNVTVVTSIAEEHLEGLGDLAGVMREELAACDGVAMAVVPASQPDVVAEARKRARRVIAAGVDEGDLRADQWTLDTDGSGRVTVGGKEVRVPLRGVHNLRNTMLALAVARELGVPVERAAEGIARMSVPPMRSNVEQLGQATLVNDAYNSNPGSARAALELLQHAGRGRQRVAVLGTMLELGPSGPSLHESLARDALASPIEVLAGLGEFAAAFDRAADASARQRLVTADDVESLWNRLASRLEPDAVILLKASRGVRLEQLVPKIREWAAGKGAKG